MDITIHVNVWYDRTKEAFEAQIVGLGGTATGRMASNAVLNTLALNPPAFRPGNTIQLKIRETAPRG